MNKVETRLKGLMLVSLIMVLINVVVGAYLTFYLNISTKIAGVIIGTAVLLQGMFYFIRYLYDGLGKKVFAVDLIVAVVDIVLGAFSIFFPFESLGHVGIVFGLHLFGNAAEKCYYAVKLRDRSDASYPLFFVIVLLLVVMGVMSMINPFKAFILSSKLVGLFMMCSGVFEGMMCKLFFDKAKAILKMF